MNKVADYRYRIVDGPTSMGSLEIEKKRFRFPILLDQCSEDTSSFNVVSGSSGWHNKKITSSNETMLLPEGMYEPHLRSLRKMKIDPLAHHVSRSGPGLRMEVEDDTWDLGALVLPYFQIISREPARAMEALMGYRGSDLMHPPLYVPGLASASNIELLIYLGVEILDTISFRLDAASSLYHTRNGPMDIEQVIKGPGPSSLCSCDACRELEGAEVRERFELLKAHNINEAMIRMNHAVLNLEHGKLRELVMSKLAGYPEWMSALRRMEDGRLSIVLDRTPTFRKSGQVKVTYRDDLNAPDLLLWRSRMEEEYSPFFPRPIMLLLPCSARKPYSRSRTHSRINSALSSIKKWRRYVHRIVITSPLGVVPMELEDLYPASYYDIPVTGEWFTDEVKMIRDLTADMVRKESPWRVICFHGEGDQFYPEDMSDQIFNGTDMVDIRKMSRENGMDPFSLLREVVKDSVQEIVMSEKEGKDEDLRTLIGFSLGCSVEGLENLYIRNTRHGRVVLSGKVPIFDLRKGGPIPTKIGGERLWNSGIGSRGRSVIIEDFVPKGTVFGQGIKDVTRTIHPGDIVLVGTDEEYRGVGRALVDHKAMLTDVPGPAVQMISHVKEGDRPSFKVR
ncbi:MAG: DUF5591 domain-containing protein [Candidatus Thermoplasmatota archaeon]|nr:DUF5591 domain-containing protein [Candidatus Thermoplasmatota archaeon]